MKALVVLFAALGFMSCTASIVNTGTAGLDEYYGFTTCENDRGVAFANLRMADSVSFRGTVAHEQKHVEQVNRIGNCILYSVWLGSNRAEAEAEAFCEDVKLDQQPPRSMTRDSAQSVYAGWMSNRGAYPQLNMTKDSALVLLRKFC